MPVIIAIVVTAVIVALVLSKLNSGVRFEEHCAERIQGGFINNGTPIELGTARLMLRNAVLLVTKINESDDDPVFINLKRAREIAVAGILESIQDGLDPFESVERHYRKQREKEAMPSAQPIGTVKTDSRANSLPENLVFKTVEGAFQHVCRFMTTTPTVKHTLPGIVKKVLPDNTAIVLVPNDKNGFINQSPMVIHPELGAVEEGVFVLFGIKSVQGKEDINGVILQKIKPSLNLKRLTWIPENA